VIHCYKSTGILAILTTEIERQHVAQQWSKPIEQQTYLHKLHQTWWLFHDMFQISSVCSTSDDRKSEIWKITGILHAIGHTFLFPS